MLVKQSYLWLLLRLFGTFIVPLLIAGTIIETMEASILVLISCVILYLVFAYNTAKLAFDKKNFLKLLEAEVCENRLEIFHLLLGPFALIGIFAVTSCALSLLYPDLFVLSSIREWEKPGQTWVLFALDQSFRAIALDLLETYHIHLASVDYRAGFLIPTFIFVYKTFLAIFFWKFVINYFLWWRPALKASKS